MLYKPFKDVKGQALNKMMAAVLVLMTIGAVGLVLKKQFGAPTQYFSSQTLTFSMDACKQRGTMNPVMLQYHKYPPGDGDNYPDICDVCPVGDSSQDRDSDGMPDVCDVAPDLPNQNGCDSSKGLKIDKDRNQCLCRDPSQAWRIDRCA